MLQLLSNPERLVTMGQNGREIVLCDYTWFAVAGRMSVAYDLFTMRQPFQ
jgi:hypothetical protein